VPTALVTGATGLVGSHITERLRRDGWNVRALVRERDGEKARGGNLWDGIAWLRAQGVSLAAGDILDVRTFVEAARGCEMIFHTAAAVTPPTQRAHPYDAYRIPNVEGTRNAITAAERSGARLLQLSSVAVYGPKARYDSPAGREQRSGGVDETTPLRPLPERAFYARSKRESEDLVLEAHAAGRIWATAVRPDVIYGPRDRQFVPRIARLLRLRVAPIVGGGRTTLAIVHAAHVADGAVLAATTSSAGGRVYNLANDFDVTVADFLRLAARGLGHTVQLVRVPVWLAQLGLSVTKGMLSVVRGGGMSVVTSASLAFLTKDNPFTSDRARQELGWNPTLRPDIGVPESFRWWTEQRR
jgi:nucleoside-diphosphate-sugar epimerase